MTLELPNMILIPRGYFVMGGLPVVDRNAFTDEHPMHPVYLSDFWISEVPITNIQYSRFIAEQKYPEPEGWNAHHPPIGKEDHPVTNVSWQDAVQYCQWLSSASGHSYRLPSEAEWEKAARGSLSYIYPWGYEWQAEWCNTKEKGINDTTPVGSFVKSASPYGILDMAGNVFEWTNTLWGSDLNSTYRYPYNPSDGREEIDAGDRSLRIVRGGSFLRPSLYARCSAKVKLSAITRMVDIGFRIALTPQLP